MLLDTQHSSKPTRPRLYPQTSHFHNSWRYKRRECPPGNSNPSSKSQTASLRLVLRLSFSILNAASRATYLSPNKMRSTTGRPKSTINPNLHSSALVFLRNLIPYSGSLVGGDIASPLVFALLTHAGWHKSSIAYTSTGQRRHNQPFSATNYGPEFVQGDVVGVGYRPRTGTVFFTRNGKKLEDVAHGLKTQNFFPTVGANGPCSVHVNFGQSGFVFIEANVKKWGLAPMTGSLAPPPPYGSEQGSILLEAGRDGTRPGQGSYIPTGHSRSRNTNIRAPLSPGPQRSPTEISLGELAHIPSSEDIGEGTSRSAEHVSSDSPIITHDPQDFSAPPPEYTSPEGSLETTSRRNSDGSEGDNAEYNPLLRSNSPRPPVPSYDVAMASESRT